MSSPPPTKPPRGVKQGKETSGLLMSVIRTLSASETNEQREKERAKLEKEYQKSDVKLDELVSKHASEIMEVMQKFEKTNIALNAWGQHCDAAVARLSACRTLLQLRRDDLKRLWTDARTHHHALQMLTDIERVVTSEREVRDALSSNRVLGAATVLSEALATADTTLAHVHALHNTRQHLQNKKQELVGMIVKDLCSVVYSGDPDPITRRPSARRRLALLLAELTKGDEVTDEYLQDITPEFEASLTEEDKTFETTVMISLEALGVLDQLKEATEKFKVQIQSSLLEVVEITSRRILEEGDGDIEGQGEGEQDGETGEVEGSTESRPLLRLVTRLSEEFEACAERNKRLVLLWRAALQKRQLSDSTLHTENQYWTTVQQVMQLLLTHYVEIESVTLEAQRTNITATTDATPNLRITDYFAKKRVQARRPKLFSLTVDAETGHVSSIPARSGAFSGRSVCAPSPAHLAAILPQLHAICAHIEGLTGGGECILRAFITQHVRCGEARRLVNEARRAIDAAMKDHAAWRVTITPPGSTLPVVSCVYQGWLGVHGAASGAARCGSYGGAEAARAVLPALATLAVHCKTHSAVVATEAKAYKWLADDDIVRFLQSLPNWKVATSIEPINEDRQFTQELSQAYAREAEILGADAAGATTIVADLSSLAHLALLSQSMDWLSTNIRSIPSLLTSTSGVTGAAIKLTDKFLDDISAAAQIFDEISHRCLLFLHLELRIQCFHYLCEEEPANLAMATPGEEKRAGGAGRLSHALLSFHEQATKVLATKKLAYVMNGIGEMMSAAVIRRCQNSSASSAPLATLRHCLAALQLPDAGLHAASNYLAMLNDTPEAIIKSIKDKGPQFTELEYLNAFKVIGARRGVSHSDMKTYLKQLSTASGHVGVTV